MIRFLFASALLVASIPASWAFAQATEDPWDEPLNLSHSGIATKPSFVIDSQGVGHVVWQDDLERLVYTRFDGEQWSTPVTTNLDDLFDTSINTSNRSELPTYTGPNPLFVTGPSDYIFAFWLSQSGLWTARARNRDFRHVSAWDSVSLVERKAASFAAAVDALGEWHLAYLRTADEPGHPPGVYYTHSKSNGRYWSVPELLYESTYFRGLGEGEANLSLVTGGTDEAPHVYIAWDNRPRKQVFLTQSADGGRSWEQPKLIASPAPDAELAGPFNIHVGASENNVVLVWQNGIPEGACSQVYQSSRDAGATWSSPQPMFENLFGCAQSTEFVTALANRPEGPLYYLIETTGEVFLTAWNGLEWSQPQAQLTLSGFVEPEIYTEVLYGCRRTALSGERLYVVGCDEGGGGDVWVTSRDLDLDTLGIEPPVWSPLSSITSDHLAIETIQLVPTDDGRIHAFFSQHQDPVIYYTYWDGGLWSHIAPVLKLPEGQAGSPAIAAGPKNELFLIASNNMGSLHFSRATSDTAATKSSWSTPTRIGIDHDGEIGAADVAWDSAGTVYVAYSIPVNERRGIYLVKSMDHGASWSEPLQVFNGAAAGFDLVGAPSLLIPENDSLHITWKQQSIRGDGVSQSLSLFYAQSEDGGRTFRDAQHIVEEPVSWREIMADGKGNLHLLWQPEDTVTTVWDQVSLDGGNSWQFPQGVPDKGKFAAVTRDPAGRLHLVGVGSGMLDLWLWDGSRWQSEEPLPSSLAPQQEDLVELLEAAVNKDGEMIVVLVAPMATGDAMEMMLLYSTRTLELQPDRTTIQEVPTQTPLPATLTPATPTPKPLLTPTTSIDNGPANEDQSDGVEADDPITPFTLALLPVAIFLLSILGVVIRQAVQAKDR